MDKYIQALIALHNSVILPGFGALSITNEETGEIMFNEYLKFNDGKLESYIAEQEGIDKQDATNMIAKYVRDLELLLNKGESYDIFQFGRFVKKPDGSFDFENWSSFSEEGSSTYITPAKKTKKEDKKVAEVEEEKPKEKEKEKEIEKEIEIEIDKKEKEAETKSLKKEVISAEEIDSIKEVYEKPADRTLSEEEKKQSKNKFTPTESSEKTSEEKVSEKPQVPLKETPKPESDKKKVEAKKPKEKVEKKIKSDKPKKKRSVFFIPVVILIIILGAAGTFVGVFPDEAKKLVGWEDVSKLDDASETKSNEEQDTQGSDETDVNDNSGDSDYTDEENTEDLTEDDITSEIVEGIEETVPEDVIEPVQTTSGNYHIIVGSFGEIQNAEKLAKALQSKGYDAKIIGPVNNLHMVSFSAYESMEAAQGNLQKAIEETGGGWILKR